MLRQRTPLKRRTPMKPGKGFKKCSTFKYKTIDESDCPRLANSESSVITTPAPNEIKRGGFKAKPKPINPVGKTGRKNQNAVRIQSDAFEQVGIFWCELDIEHDCDGALHFSHSKKKSRGITEDERIYLVVRQCDNSHAKLTEGKPDQEQQILRIILAREPINHPFFRRSREIAQAVWNEKYAE
jgi:hypothetical protein